jgi:hypothetical protein
MGGVGHDASRPFRSVGHDASRRFRGVEHTPPVFSRHRIRAARRRRRTNGVITRILAPRRMHRVERRAILRSGFRHRG